MSTITLQPYSSSGEFRGGIPSDFSPRMAKNKVKSYLTGLCLGKNTLSRALRGLASTKAGISPLR